MINVKTHGRIGILGNPSDMYDGVVISSTINELFVEGTIERASEDQFLINNSIDASLNSLVKSTILLLDRKKCKLDKFKYHVQSNIPKQAGLAGSTAIIVNLIKGLNELCSLGLDPMKIAHYTRKVEHEIIGNTAGPQDCFVVLFGGIKYMDFSSGNYKSYLLEDIDISDIPFYVGVRTKNVSSGDIHKYPFEAYPNSPKLQTIVDKIGSCAIEGKEAILNEDLKKIGELMNLNQKLTQSYGKFGNPAESVILQRKIDQEILDYCNEHEVIGAKLGGSSGSIIILDEGKPDFLLDYKPHPDLLKELEKYDSSPSENQISQVIKLKPAKAN
jgi:mevalonate kinase